VCSWLADYHAHFDHARRHRPAGQPVTDTACVTDNLVVLITAMIPVCAALVHEAHYRRCVRNALYKFSTYLLLIYLLATGARGFSAFNEPVPSTSRGPNIKEQVVKVILHKGRIVAAHGRFSHLCQVAPMCIPSNTSFLGPTRVHIPNGISIGSAVFSQLTEIHR